MSAEQVINNVIEYLREHHEEIFSTPPEKIVDDIMYAVEQYGKLAKLYLRANWGTIKPYLTKPVKTLELIHRRDPELYNIMIQHVDWLNEFFRLLYKRIKQYMST